MDFEIVISMWKEDLITIAIIDYFMKISLKYLGIIRKGIANKTKKTTTTPYKPYMHLLHTES